MIKYQSFSKVPYIAVSTESSSWSHCSTHMSNTWMIFTKAATNKTHVIFFYWYRLYVHQPCFQYIYIHTHTHTYRPAGWICHSHSVWQLSLCLRLMYKYIFWFLAEHISSPHYLIKTTVVPRIYYIKKNKGLNLCLSFLSPLLTLNI